MQETRKLTVTGTGRSYYITLPKWMIKQLKWKKGQRLSVTLRGKTVRIKDWQEGDTL